MMSDTVKWEKLHVLEEGCSMKARHTYFLGKKDVNDFKLTSFSKFIQIDGQWVYAVGGSNNRYSLFAREYDVPSSCLRIDMKSGKL
jgi:hypothetical protein